MKQEQTGKSMVSKSRYAANVGGKIVLTSFGVAILLFGIVGTILACILLVVMLMNLDTKDPLLPLVLCLMVIDGGAAALLYFGVSALKEAKHTDVGLPLTRANTADLPAPDSLVRASQEPVQAQEGVLLRAAMGDAQEEQEEQLLRASAGK